MCGISGYAGADRPHLLKAMCDRMTHRGPDDAGYWHDSEQRVGLGHRRLSIIDLSQAGHQPMTNEDQTIWLAYNGEIYNFQDLREKLLARGHQFRSQTDTEVIVHLYEEYGLDFVDHLNGMFALALWDCKCRRLVLARDHAGIKPLYYWLNGSQLYFASEIKALLAIPELPRNLNHDVVSQYLTFLWVPGNTTMLESVNKVEPGHMLVWEQGKVKHRRWYNLSYEPDESLTSEQWSEKVYDTFSRVTQRQMVSDVPLGAFLSGGTDSSAIVACMRNHFPDRPITCYTCQQKPSDMKQDLFADDYPYARQVADHLGVHLKSFVLEPDVVSLLPKMVYHLDEPDADPAIFPSYLISQFAREDGTTVLLSGTGGDEVFFGYRSHQAYRTYQKMQWMPRSKLAPLLSLGGSVLAKWKGAQHPLSRRVAKFRRGLLADGLDRHMALVDWSDPEIRNAVMVGGSSNNPGASMQQYYDAFQGKGEINRHSHMLIQTFLASHNFLYTDKTSMAASIEVRVPFVDRELMELCARIPERHQIKGGVTKWLLKKSMQPHLPNDILYRSKTGFGAPLRKWINDDLSEMLGDLLHPKRIKDRGLFDSETVDHIMTENRANRADYSYLLYSLVTLELWQQAFLDEPSVVPTEQPV